LQLIELEYRLKKYANYLQSVIYVTNNRSCITVGGWVAVPLSHDK